MTTSQRFETACGRTLNEWATRWPRQGRVEPACGCTRRLRAARPETKILLTSGYSQEAVFQNEIVEPATAFLAKPFTIGQLRTRVREVLDAPPAR